MVVKFSEDTYSDRSRSGCPCDSTKEEKLYPSARLFINRLNLTQCNQQLPALPVLHQAPILLTKSAQCNGRCCGNHQSRHRHFLTRAIHLWMLISFINDGWGSILVGLSVGLLLATSFHSPSGTARWRYAMAAKQCGSIEGRENPGPQTWSSRAMSWPEVVCALHLDLRIVT